MGEFCWKVAGVTVLQCGLWVVTEGALARRGFWLVFGVEQELTGARSGHCRQFNAHVRSWSNLVILLYHASHYGNTISSS